MNNKHAERRKNGFNKFNRTVNLMFRLNTAHETKDETRELVRKRTHCEQIGRRRSNWLASYAKNKMRDEQAKRDAKG